MTAFDKCFLFLDSPRGGTDQLDKMKAAGFQGCFANVRDYAPHEWEVDHLPRARVLGMFFGPWGRTGKGLSDRVWAPEVLKLIVDTADRWGSPLVVNSEKEIDATGATCTKEIAAVVGQRDAAISTEARLYDAVDWMPVAHLPCLNQIFPVESDWAHNPAGCKALAHKRGFRCAYFTFGAYGGMKPGDFDLKAPYSVYTADPIGPENYGQWSPTSTGFVGCPPVPAPPPPNPGGNVNVPFTRLLQKDDVGPDVEGVGRALCRAKAGVSVTVFNALPATIRRTFGARKVSWTKAFQKSHGLPQDGVYGRKTHERLTPFFDAKATNLMLQYKPPAAMCFPFPVGAGGSVCQGFHATAGLPGNWAIDFCGSANTAVLAPEAGKIQKLSGHSPTDDTWDAQGIYGWSVYVRTSTGYVYFITHLGWRADLTVGQSVQAGEILGRVGDQHYRPDHTHVGVTSPLGETDARKRIASVSKSPRVAGT